MCVTPASKMWPLSIFDKANMGIFHADASEYRDAILVEHTLPKCAINYEELQRITLAKQKG